MKYITLPSGLIINLEQVAYISAPGIYGDKKPKHERLHICFSATYTTERSLEPMKLTLQAEDAKAFLEELAKTGVETRQAMSALTKK
jgi:hypothetical protein